MRFLVDAQLPPALARHLSALGHDAEHVGDIGLLAAADRCIWDYAEAQDAVLITKDEDFIALRALTRSGPAVVWIRIGNTTRRALIARFTASFPALLDSLERGEKIVQLC